MAAESIPGLASNALSQLSSNRLLSNSDRREFELEIVAFEDCYERLSSNNITLNEDPFPEAFGDLVSNCQAIGFEEIKSRTHELNELRQRVRRINDHAKYIGKLANLEEPVGRTRLSRRQRGPSSQSPCSALRETER